VKKGYAMVDQELDSGLRSVAVPVFAGNGELLGAINISTNAGPGGHDKADGGVSAPAANSGRVGHDKHPLGRCFRVAAG